MARDKQITKEDFAAVKKLAVMGSPKGEDTAARIALLNDEQALANLARCALYLVCRMIEDQV
jgi:hypothetical protein